MTDATDLRKQAQELMAQADEAEANAQVSPLADPKLSEIEKLKLAIDVVMSRIEAQMQLTGNYVMLDVMRKEFGSVRKALGLRDPYAEQIAAMPKNPQALPPHVRG